MELRPLILRANRLFGSTLVDVGLLSIDDLEEANELFVARLKEADPSTVSILSILLMETKKLREADLISFLVENRKLSVISLRNYKVRAFEFSRNNTEILRSTLTIPFDKVGDYYLVATAYGLSEPALKQWREILDGPVIFYVATVSDILEAIQAMTETKEGSGSPEEEE